jgi:hypothetical protein
LVRKYCGFNNLKDVTTGPEETHVYCPWWVPSVRAVLAAKGALKIEDVWLCAMYPGLGAIFASMINTLQNCESAAGDQYLEWKRKHPDTK